jgi:hypothetical protein
VGIASCWSAGGWAGLREGVECAGRITVGHHAATSSTQIDNADIADVWVLRPHTTSKSTALHNCHTHQQQHHH